ncbi:hypothetical protein RPHASCH2410_CH07525 [Rhizobium phaseoli Ch24-10]|nr:hypothetical protein RPHASCH2410_CH07525 [Rhizobium phaseoli Ch24-10]
MCIKHILSFNAGARAIADIRAQRTVDRNQCDVSRARQREAFCLSFLGNPCSRENRAKASGSSGRKHPAILPHDRSAVGLAEPAHPGLPVVPPLEIGRGRNISSEHRPETDPADARKRPPDNLSGGYPGWRSAWNSGLHPSS